MPHSTPIYTYQGYSLSLIYYINSNSVWLPWPSNKTNSVIPILLSNRFLKSISLRISIRIVKVIEPVFDQHIKQGTVTPWNWHVELLGKGLLVPKLFLKKNRLVILLTMNLSRS